MSIQTTPQGERTQIVIFGKRNAGKSSVLNALTGQQMAIVSDVAGTTTDPVGKAMEILPIGPCMITDTAGLDDEGELGKKRMEKSLAALHKADIALIIIDINTYSEEIFASGRGVSETEYKIIEKISEKNIPYILVLNQTDRMERTEAEKLRQLAAEKNGGASVVLVSAETNDGIEALKQEIIKKLPKEDKDLKLLGDLVNPGEIVVLVTPIDSAAPKGRLIMPQQQTIRDLLDHHAACVVTQVEELTGVLESLRGQVKLVVTDSQAFREVDMVVPKEIRLTSFSILFARKKGNLQTLIDGVRAVENLKDGDRVLIAEGCTHHRQCEDIGTVKIPNLLKKYTGKELSLEWSSGTGFPEKLSEYALVIHCGGCTLSEKEMKYRLEKAGHEAVPIVNYGIFLAYANGILERSIEVFPDISV